MLPILLANFVHGLAMFIMCVTAVFLILLVLVQRGRGGGLAGALGGMGGQSAFGTKAGDLFTRITIVAATFWILLAIAAITLLGGADTRFGRGAAGDPPPAGIAPPTTPGTDGAGQPEPLMPAGTDP